MMHTRQEKVEWWQNLINDHHGQPNITGMARSHDKAACPATVSDVEAMKTRMPKDLQEFMGGDRDA